MTSDQLEELRDISEEEYLLEFVKVEQYVHALGSSSYTASQHNGSHVQAN